MLSETKMVKVRKALELGYFGVCDIFEFKEITNPDKSSSFSESLVSSGIACKLSYGTSGNSKDTAIASTVAQQILLFLSPDITVKTGSKIIVTQNNITQTYENSGEPLIFPTHQQIYLKLFDEWT